MLGCTYFVHGTFLCRSHDLVSDSFLLAIFFFQSFPSRIDHSYHAFVHEFCWGDGVFFMRGSISVKCIKWSLSHEIMRNSQWRVEGCTYSCVWDQLSQIRLQDLMSAMQCFSLLLLQGVGPLFRTASLPLPAPAPLSSFSPSTSPRTLSTSALSLHLWPRFLPLSHPCPPSSFNPFHLEPFLLASLPRPLPYLYV